VRFADLFSLAIAVCMAAPSVVGKYRTDQESPSDSFSSPAGAASSRAADVHLSGPAMGLPFTLLSGFLIEVSGEIDGRTQLRFVLDTGSTVSMIDKRLAGRMGLSLQPAKTLGFDAEVTWGKTIVPKVSFGQIKAENVEMMVGDLSAFSSYTKGMDAIIGTDLLKLANFSIDYDSRKIVFQSMQRQYARRASEPLLDCVVAELVIQGHPVRLIVDSGLPGVLLYEERIRHQVPGLKFIGTPTRVIMGSTLHGQRAVLPHVMLGTRFDDLTVFLTHAPSVDWLPGIDGMVGLKPFGARRIHFDFGTKHLTWE